LDEFEAQLPADDRSRSLQRCQGDVAVLGIEQAADLAATRPHALGKTLARQLVRLHGFAELPGNHLLDRYGLEFLELALTLEEIVEGRQFRCGARELFLRFMSYSFTNRIHADAVGPRQDRRRASFASS
jgi:hypothetical protein